MAWENIMAIAGRQGTQSTKSTGLVAGGKWHAQQRSRRYTNVE